MATGGKQTESLANIKQDLDEKSRQIFEIDLKIQEFSGSGRDTADLEEAKCLLQQDIVDLQIRYKLQKGQKQEEEEKLGGYHRGEGDSHPEALYQGSCSMNCFTSSLHSYSHFLSQSMKSRSN